MAQWGKDREALVDMDRWVVAKSYIQDKLSLRTVAGNLGLSNQDSHAMVPCLFHDEKVPSFSISYEEGLWHCFSCQRGGTVIDLIRHTETLLHSNPLDRYSVIDFILNKYKVLATSLGYTTVFRDPEAKLEEDLSDPLYVSVEVGDQLLASTCEVRSLQRVCSHLTAQLSRVRREIKECEGRIAGLALDQYGSTGEQVGLDDQTKRLELLRSQFNELIDKCMFLGKAGELGLPETYIIEKLTATEFEDTLRDKNVGTSEEVMKQAGEAFEDFLLNSE